MDYKDTIHDEGDERQDVDRPTEPHTTSGQGTARETVRPTPEQMVAQGESAQEAPSTPGAQGFVNNPAPTTPGAQGTARPRVYGKLNVSDAAPYYNAPNPYYQAGDSLPRPEPRPLGSERSDAPGRGAYYSNQPFNSDGNAYTRYVSPQATTEQEAGAAAKLPLVDRKRFVILVVIIIAAMIASGITGGVIGSNMSRKAAPLGVASSSGNISITPSADVSTTEAVAQKVLDSVVGITSTVTNSGGNYFGFDFGGSESGGVGTGIIVDASGYILTNSHVVLDGEFDKIEVLLSDGSTIPGKLLWNDSSVDLAIIKIDAAGNALKPAELGDSDKVKIGSYVAAIGNPLGLDFNGSITQGVVSGLGRSISASSGNGNVTTMEDLIQVDAAINSGNSGGPLLDREGKVIGVNTAKAQAEGMGFAIPINIAKPIVEKVIKTGSFERVYMGVSAADASIIAEQYPNLGLKEDVKGAFITAVSGDSPADDAGLKMKDIVTSVDDKAVDTSGDLIKALLNYSVGDKVKVAYERNGEEATVEVTLASQKEVYGEWNNGSSESGGSGGGTPSDPYGELEPENPFSNPFE
ncbi:MAG: S1C family serine protease [Clostridiales Family XIII bacterium]|jgi:S1-C subfamily serine protease|nr:S1C family serine protease [Clostridiales Family XIII bacterium]